MPSDEATTPKAKRRRGRPAAGTAWADLPRDLRDEIGRAVARHEKPSHAYARLQLGERGLTWHGFYHHWRKLIVSARGEPARKPSPMQVWADAMAQSILRALLEHYPPVFVAEIVERGAETTSRGPIVNALARTLPTPAQVLQWPVSDVRPQGFIDVKEAVRRAKNSTHYTGSRKSDSTIENWVHYNARFTWPHVPSPVLFEGKLYLSPLVHPALYEPVDDRFAQDKVEALTAKGRTKLAAKMTAVRDFWTYLRADENKRLGVCELRARFVANRQGHYTYLRDGQPTPLKLAVSTFEKWENALRKFGVDGLLPSGNDGRGRGPLEVSEAATAMYWRIRNDPRRFKMKYVWRDVADFAKREGWTWFENVTACRNWDRRTRNDRQLILNQRGDLEYTKRCGQYVEVDPESFDSGECWIGDDTTIDAWVEWPDGAISRPVLTAYLDWRTRLIVGYRVSRTGNSDSLVLAFRDAAKEWGLPSTAIIDNGKNFSSWAWTGGAPKRQTHERGEAFKQRMDGLFALCSVIPSWALPYNPNAKGRLERWFGTLEDQFIRALPSYCGATPEDRPEKHAALVAKAVPAAGTKLIRVQSTLNRNTILRGHL